MSHFASPRESLRGGEFDDQQDMSQTRPDDFQQGQFVRIEDLEQRLRSYTPLDFYRSLDERVRSDADNLVQFEVRLNTALEERLQAYSATINQSFQTMTQSYTPIAMHQELELVLTNLVPVQNFNDLQQHVNNIQRRVTSLDTAFSESHNELVDFQAQLVAKMEEIIAQCETLSTDVASEREERIQDIEKLNKMCIDHHAEHTNGLAEANRIRAEGDSQLELRLKAELAASHQQCVGSLRELSDAQLESNKLRTEGFNQLESRFKADRDLQNANAKMVEERHDAEIEDLRRRIAAETTDRGASHQQLMSSNQQLADELVENNRMRVESLSQLEMRLKAELASSYQQHMTSVRKLSDAQSESDRLRIESFNQLESRFKSDQELQNKNAKIVEDRHDAETNNIKMRLASLEPRVESNALQVSSIHGEITQAIGREGSERNAQIEALGRRMDSENLNRSTQLNALAARQEEQNASQDRLADLHQQLDTSHRQLSRSQNELANSHKQLSDSHQQLKGTHGELTGSHQRLADSFQELQGSHKGLQDSQKGLQETHRELASAHNQLARSHGDLSGQHRELVNSHHESREAGRELIKTEEAIRTRKFEELSSKLNDHNNKLHSHSATHEEFLLSHGELSAGAARIHELQELSARVDKLAASHDQLRNANLEHGDAISQANVAHTHFRNQCEAQLNLVNGEKKVLELNMKDSHAKLEEKLTAIEPRIDAAVLQLGESLRREANEHSAQLEAVRSRLHEEGAARARDHQEIYSKMDNHRVSQEKLGLAHDKLMNSHNELFDSHKTRAREIQEICSKLDGHRVLQDKLGLAHDKLMNSHNELSYAHKSGVSEHSAQLEAIRLRVHDEGATRAREIQEVYTKLDTYRVLHEKLGAAHNQLINSHNELSHSYKQANSELSSQLEATRLRMHDESATRARDIQEFSTKLDNHRVQQEKLGLAHSQLMTSHSELADAHSRANDSHRKSFDQLALRLDTEIRISLEKYDSEISDVRTAMQRLVESNGADRADAEKRWEEIQSLHRENQKLWGARFSEIEPRINNIETQVVSFRGEVNFGLQTATQKIERAEGVLRGEFGEGLSELRRHIDSAEASLDRNFRAGLQQTNTDLQKLTADHKEEARLRRLSMQELYAKQFQDLSQMANKAESLIMNFTNEQKYAISDLKGDAETMQNQLQQQINVLERELRSAEEDRSALKKAHDEHVRCLDVERDAHQQVTELRANHFAEMSNFIREHTKAADELRAMVGNESETRARELAEVNKMLDRKITEFLNRESRDLAKVVAKEDDDRASHDGPPPFLRVSKALREWAGPAATVVSTKATHSMQETSPSSFMLRSSRAMN